MQTIYLQISDESIAIFIGNSYVILIQELYLIGMTIRRLL